MASSKPLLGLCPIGKFVFSHKDALHWKRQLQASLRKWRIPYADLESVLPDGMVRQQAHVNVAVQHFQQAGVAALFTGRRF